MTSDTSILTSTTSYKETTSSSSSNKTIDPTTSATTPPPSISTTTPSPPPPVSSTTKEIATSTPVPIVTVTTSGTVVRTFTSTSYSSYITHVATAVPSQGGGGNGSTNVGAIAGGVVGGVAAIVLIGFIVIVLSRRRRNKNKKEASYESETGGVGGPMNPHPFANDYNTYGSPTVVSDNNSLPSSRPLSMSTAPSQGIKPRPFVQAYNPAYDDQHQQYAGYDGSQSPPQEHYYNDYNQAYNNNYNNNSYSHDAYYAHQQEPMIPISTSTTTGLSSSNHGRNVPDENDYDLTRKVSRHVPDEIN
ncbi:hypothetical protein PS15p_204733 [Mucor circinelloides]